MAEERVRIEIGFDGGQIMGALVSSEEADRLERHLQAGDDGIVGLATEDGRYLVVAPRVVYVKRFARDSRVGFGGAT